MEFCLYSHYYICYIVATCEEIFAGVAQLVEQRFCKPRVVRSIRIASFGQIPKWSTGTDCKSVAHALRGFESFSAHQFCGRSSMVEHHCLLPLSLEFRESSSVVEHQPSKLVTRVRFPSLAPN